MKNIDFNIYQSLIFFRNNNIEKHADIIEQYFTSDRDVEVSGVSTPNTEELISGGA